MNKGTPLSLLFLPEFTYKYILSQGVNSVESLLSSIALLPGSWEALFGRNMLERIKTEIYLLTGKTVYDFSSLPRLYKYLELRKTKEGEEAFLKDTKLPATAVWTPVRQKTQAFPVSRTILDWAHNNWEHPAFPLNLAGRPCIPLEAVLECVEYGDKNKEELQKQAKERIEKYEKALGRGPGAKFILPSNSKKE